MPDLEHQLRYAKDLLSRPGGRLHLMGIGGAGVSGLSTLLQAAGFSVDGCDATASRMTDTLRARGIEVVPGHDPTHLRSGDRGVIRSAAVPADHPEVRRAEALKLPVIVRGAMLAALASRPGVMAVAGTHGKTTSASMLAQLLDRLGPRTGYCIGGESSALPAPARPPGPDGRLVVEADESDGTLRLYAPGIAVVTNVDFDHMEHFRSISEFQSVFEQFVRQAGRVALGTDDPGAARLLRVRPDALSFGLNSECAVRGESIELREGTCSFDLWMEGRQWGRATLPVGGLFNVKNALAAFAAARLAGASPDTLAEGLNAFQPALRRQQRLDAGRGVTVILDYAHHPAEIRALLEALRPMTGRRLVALFQPHRYTRTRALGPDFPAAFERADKVVLLPVYEASESPMPGGDGPALLRHFHRAGRPPVVWADDFEAARVHLLNGLEPGDLLAVVGAGDVDRLGAQIAAALAGGDSRIAGGEPPAYL